MEEIRQMTPLHLLAMNPYASPDIMSGIIVVTNMSAALSGESKGITPIDCARQYNVPGLLKMIEALCLHRQQHQQQHQNASKIAKYKS